jgi:hypothetical protein
VFDCLILRLTLQRGVPNRLSSEAMDPLWRYISIIGGKRSIRRILISANGLAAIKGMVNPRGHLSRLNPSSHQLAHAASAWQTPSQRLAAGVVR